MRKLPRRHWFIAISLLLIGLTTACSQGQEPDNAASTSPATATSFQEVEPAELSDGDLETPEETFAPQTGQEVPTAEPTMTAEANNPSVSASHQVLGDDGQVTIDQVTTEQDGWIVVYVDDDGKTGEVLGHTPVSEGTSEGILVTIDPLLVGEALYIVLHGDDGEAGKFEFPGPDQPLEYEGQPIEDHFRIDNRATIPEVEVSNQEVLEDGVVTIDVVAATRPGWLALHIDDGGAPGKIIAYVPVESGINEQLMLTINWREATTLLHAVLYEDAGENGHFEETRIDKPVRLEGTPVAVIFEARYPPDVYVVNQPVVDGNIVIERAVSYGPGWLVIYFDEEGQIGNIIGQAPLSDGINEQIVVPIVETAATPLLHLMLHQDTDEIGEFEFPRADPMVVHQGSVPHPISFRTDAGNYLVTRDQQISAGGDVVVPLIAVEEDAWVVIYSDSEGEIGELIGLTWLPAGLHRDTVVNIDPEKTTAILHAVLHIDAGRIKEFEYPDNPDVPFRRNLNVIDSPFTLQQD